MQRMRFRARHLSLGAVVAGLGVVVWPAAASAAGVTVSPAQGLDPAGQIVVVRGSGFRPGIALFVMECRASSAEDHTCNSVGLQKVTTDATGAFATRLSVVGRFGATDCLQVPCGIKTSAVSGHADDRSQDTSAPLSFRAAPAPTAPPATTPPATAPPATAPPATAPPTSAPVASPSTTAATATSTTTTPRTTTTEATASTTEATTSTTQADGDGSEGAPNEEASASAVGSPDGGDDGSGSGGGAPTGALVAGGVVVAAAAAGGVALRRRGAPEPNPT